MRGLILLTVLAAAAAADGKKGGAVACAPSPWSSWTACSESCHKPGAAVGVQSRTRTEGCGGVTSQETDCNTQCCAGFEHAGGTDGGRADLVVTEASQSITSNFGKVSKDSSGTLQIQAHLQVELVRSTAASQSLAFSDAKQICSQRGATWRVCSMAEVRQAFRHGLRTSCKCGWANDGHMYKSCDGLAASPWFSDCDGEVAAASALGDAFCCGQRKPPTCTRCGAGRFSAWHGAGKCHACPPGQWQDGEGAAKCKSCAKGTSSAKGATACVQCGHGKHAAKAGQHACEDCPAGSEASSQGAHACVKCQAGYYADDIGTRNCKLCQTGTYAEARGAAACDACEAGTHNPHRGSASRAACTHCEPGRYARKAEAKCSACPSGTYHAQPGGVSEAACTACAAGSTSNNGAAACSPCAAGTYASNNSCQPCAAGTYQSKTGGAGASSCTPCPKGHFCAAGATTPTKCAKGTFAATTGTTAADGCTPCSKGYYAANTGSEACAECARGTYGDDAGLATCIKCAAGTAQPLKAQTEASACEPCHAGKYQPVQGQTFCVPCGVGYYHGGTGASACTACGAGRHGKGHGKTTLEAGCAVCAPGRYAAGAAANQCTACEIGKFSTTSGAVTAATCEHCDWGKYTVESGMTSCKSCRKGHYGEKQGTAKGLLTHCLRCPHGQYQRFDGSTSCEKCEAGRYMDATGSDTECKSCAVHNVDARRVYWSNSGARKCYRKKLDCKVSDWGEWSTCSRSCGGGTKSRTRAPMKQTPCGLASGCDQAWGVGALACSAIEQVQDADCNPLGCPVDCKLTQWGEWSSCSKSCGKGRTTRKRSVHTPAKNGGACNGSLNQGTFCNDHTCDFKHMPRCHGEHIHCRVASKQMNKWQDTSETNSCPKWQVHNAGDDKACHRCDTAEECELSGTHKTIVVTHDRKYANMGGQRNAFHCFFDQGNTNQCFCTCSMHPPCTVKAGVTLTNTPILGNHYTNVGHAQDCCNMCTNHPQCESFTYSSATEQCTLFSGSPVYAASSAPATTVSGCQSGDICEGAPITVSRHTSFAFQQKKLEV